MDLGTRIAAWRKHAGLTQSELASSAGISRAAMSQYESGKTVPSIPALERIVEGCGTTMEKFYGRVPKAKAA